MPGLTAAIGTFCADRHPMPEAALHAAASGVIDTVGVMLAGRRETVVAATLSTVVGDSRDGSARLLMGSRRAAAGDAAFVNATAAHVLAMDDVAAGCHPSAILMPALFAEAETLGASGRALLQAYAVGFEILVELALREPDALHSTGWHPTGVLGPVAVAAAVAHLRGLDATACTHAIGIAASMTGGLQANFGTQTKPLHLGRAAAAGVLAARLAAAGVTSSSEALEHPKGLLRTISPQGRVDVDRPFAVDFDRPRLVSVGLGVKKYPVCYTTHRVVDAAIDVASAADLAPDDIERVDVAIGRHQAAMARHRVPTTVFEAKYSVPFAVACGLLRRAAGFAELDERFVASSPVRALIDRIDVKLVDGRSTHDPVFAPADRVVVRLRDGTTLDSGDVPFARGHATQPLGEAELRRKFVDCAASGGRDDAEALYTRLTSLIAIDDVRTLIT